MGSFVSSRLFVLISCLSSNLIKSQGFVYFMLVMVVGSGLVMPFGSSIHLGGQTKTKIPTRKNMGMCIKDVETGFVLCKRPLGAVYPSLVAVLMTRADRYGLNDLPSGVFNDTIYSSNLYDNLTVSQSNFRHHPDKRHDRHSQSCKYLKKSTHSTTSPNDGPCS